MNVGLVWAGIALIVRLRRVINHVLDEGVTRDIVYLHSQ